MRFDTTKFSEAVAQIRAEFDSLKEIADMENAEELHGQRGLDEDEWQAFQAMESMLISAKAVEAVI